MNICSDAPIVPQLYESSHVSMENISLSTNYVSECGEIPKENKGDVGSNILETNNNLQGEREKFYNAIITNYPSSANISDYSPIIITNADVATGVRQSNFIESLKRKGEG